MKTEWNLKLFYKGKNDPQIEKDLKKFERLHTTFAKKYSNSKSYMINSSALLKALNDYKKLNEEAIVKPLYYYYYITALNSEDSKADATTNQLSTRLTKASNTVLFFGLNLGKISKSNQKKFLEDKRLNYYNYFLERIFKTSKYDLSEQEEKILSLKSLTSRSMWITATEKNITKQLIKFGNKKIPIQEGLNMLPSLPTQKRRALYKSTLSALKDASDFAEAEINAVFTDKKINDELRGFKNPYSSTILGYENEEKNIEDLVSIVTKNFGISKDFYKLKKEIVGLKEFTYPDRGIPIGKISTKFDFNSQVKILREIFYDIDKKYGEILDRFLKNGQIDVNPKKGKSGGAFCSSSVSTPTLVLLNNANNFRSLTTFAHEMGHAVHAERSKEQDPFYQGHTISVAETASTFFETVTFERIFQQLTKDEQTIALHDRIQDDVATVFRQIACFNFEKNLHSHIRDNGGISKEEIAQMLNKHMKSYIGSAMNFTDLDGYFFVTWSHIRNFFYVYAYAYGQLISKALASKYFKDSNFISSVDEFLTAGESKSPEDIFGDIGIKTNQALYKTGLDSISKDIDRLKKLTKK